MYVWGRNAQYDMLSEEVGELLQAVNKYKRDPNHETLDHFAEEVIDVEILLEEMKTILPTDRLEFWEDFKLRRLRKRLEKTKERQRENLERATEQAGSRIGLFKVLHDKGLIATESDMDDIMHAVALEIKVKEPEEVGA